MSIVTSLRFARASADSEAARVAFIVVARAKTTGDDELESIVDARATNTGDDAPGDDELALIVDELTMIGDARASNAAADDDDDDNDNDDDRGDEELELSVDGA